MEREAKCDDTKSRLGIKVNPLADSDPDFAAITDSFIFGEVYSHGDLNPRMKELLILVAACANQSSETLLEHTRIALELGVEPVAVKEAIYQCAPYVGIDRTGQALGVVNQVFCEAGISIPLKSQKTVREEERFGKGLDTRAAIFGKGTYAAVNQAPEHLKHIQEYLCGYCFSDFYTRGGLDLKQRELLTLCMLAALGGCESQLRSHVKGNQAVGNEKSEMIEAVTVCMPYIGFPRTLNAIACINEIIPE